MRCVQIDGVPLACSSSRGQHTHELFAVDFVIMSNFRNHPKLDTIAEGGLKHIANAALRGCFPKPHFLTVVGSWFSA